MQILIIHNNYGVYSGEESVVDKQISLFRSLGYEVNVFRRSSSELRDSFIGNLKGFFSGFYSKSAVKEIRQLLKINKPDVIIIHNLYPFISPAILKHIKHAKVPIIMTVHNYRLICPTGLFMRDSKPCELCLNSSEWHCILHNCEHSLPKSIAYASRNWYARKTKAYVDNVDKYACITKFQTIKLTQAGFDSKKMTVIPNFIDNVEKKESIKGEYVAISGRLSKEKGIDLILKVAQQTPQISYVFAGAKRQDDEWNENIPANCTFLGHLTSDELIAFYTNCKFLLIGSLCYEGFPMSIIEAASYGKPSIGPAHAGFPEIIDNGITGTLFVPGDADDMKANVVDCWNNDSSCETMGENAFKKLSVNYCANAVKDKWQDLFKELNVL